MIEVNIYTYILRIHVHIYEYIGKERETQRERQSAVHDDNIAAPVACVAESKSWITYARTRGP